MKTYQIIPQAPLVFRSSRPFGEGSRDGANFPWPSSLAGLMRTQVMDDKGWQPRLSNEQIRELQAVITAGPILARRESSIVTPILPKPADALYLLDESGNKGIYRLQPGQHEPDCGCDLPESLAPVTAVTELKGKPQDGPAFWPLESLLAWRRGDEVDFDSLDSDEPGKETRTHVALDRETLAADPGRLFQTEGLDFGRQRKGGGRGFEQADWIFLARAGADISARMVTFGGERRLSWLEPTPDTPLALPPAHRAALEVSRRISITLATPALFSQGWKPGWLDDEGKVPGIPGLRLKLVAAAVERWLGISGWDLAKWQPRAARKAVASGATYWFEIVGEPPAGWAEKLWLAPLSDDKQDRHDGFGLAIPGIWNTTNEMTKEKQAC